MVTIATNILTFVKDYTCLSWRVLKLFTIFVERPIVVAAISLGVLIYLGSFSGASKWNDSRSNFETINRMEDVKPHH